MRWLVLCLFAWAMLLPVAVAAQAETGIRISAPASGDVLRGPVAVTGTSAVDGFFASELSFAYASDATNTWFLIYSTDQPVTDGLLAAWDTTLIADGDYNLRLRVMLQDGSSLETVVMGLRVRNLTPTETATLAPTSTPEFDFPPAPSPLPTELLAPTSTPRPTPTALPPNPASVTPSEIYAFLGRGALLALLIILIVGIFLRLRRS